MKKEYIAPEMELIEQEMTQPLMTTSVLGVYDEEATDSDVLSPESEPLFDF